MLLVTNGDSAAERISRARPADEVLPWRDVLHEGPVPAGLSDARLAEVRAGYLAGRGWTSFEGALEDFTRRDATLAGSGAYEEVVLFFEHDLYDQLQLVQVLDRFSRLDLGDTRLSLAVGDGYLGDLGPEELRSRLHDRHQAAAEEFELARKAWEAFRSPDPTRVSALLHEDTAALPFLRPALLRHLEQFPSTGNGLSRSERQAMEEISKGRSAIREAYVASHLERESPTFLGDIVFSSYLEDLSEAPDPLVLFEDGGKIRAPRPGQDAEGFWNLKAVLTGKGREVLAGDEDRVGLNGIDRWHGGAHLVGESPWRWDESHLELKREAA